MKRLCHFLSVLICGIIPLLFSNCASHCSPSQCKNDLPHRSTFEKKELVLEAPGGSYHVNVTVKGTRPVLLLHELNGQSPGCLSLGKELADAGCKVYIPRFYGCYGSNFPLGWKWWEVARSSEWNLFSKQGGTIATDIKFIAYYVKKKHPGQSLTVIGNCMTGGQALALLAEPGIDTAVVCQPAAPMLPYTCARKHSFGIPAGSFEAAIAAMHANPRKRLVSFNYLSDKVAVFARTEWLARKTWEAGVAKQHHLWIGVNHGEKPRSDLFKVDPPHPGLHTLETTEMLQAHPTVTSARGNDLQVYRDKLFEELGLPPREKAP